MKTFLLDLVEDLREKRLIPVAIALAVAIVAVPVVLAKGSSPKSEAPKAQTASADSGASAAQQKIADLVKSGDAKSTDLDKFGSKDPFKPPAGYAKPPKLPSAGSPTTKTPAGGGTSTPSGGGTTSPTNPSGGGTTGGGTGGGSPKSTAYTYVADVTFSHNSNVRHRKGLGRLAMLPSSDNPLLLFLGVTEGGGNAVFLVDSSLKAVGEGKCVPSQGQCANVYLGAGAEEEFTGPDGDSYTLRVDEIRKVKVSRVRAAAKAAAARRKKAHASSGKAARRFVPPVLVDLVTASDSSSPKGGR